jgi:hypothetical protein
MEKTSSIISICIKDLSKSLQILIGLDFYDFEL